MHVTASRGGGVTTTPAMDQPSKSSSSMADVQAWNEAEAKAIGGHGGRSWPRHLQDVGEMKPGGFGAGSSTLAFIAPTPTPSTPSGQSGGTQAVVPPQTQPAGGQAAQQQPDPNAQHIHDLLSDDGFLSHDRNSHLKQIAALIHDLPPNQANKAVAGLSDSDLKRLGDGLDTGSIVPGAAGLSDNERKGLFDDLSSKVDGHHLARVSNNLGRGDKGALADSIATRSTDQQKTAYIAELAAKTTVSDDEIGGLTSELYGADANDVGRVFGSLKDSGAIDRAMNSLDTSQMTAVLKAAEHETATTNFGGGAPITMFDAQQATDVLSTAARGTDAVAKARIFSAGSGALSDVAYSTSLLNPVPGAHDEAVRIRDGLTSLLGSDTTGVVDGLNQPNNTGHALVGYLKEMVNDNQTSDTAKFIARLQEGNQQGITATTYLDQQTHDPNGQPGYRNADNLGYFVGATVVAVNKINSDAKSQADTLHSVFTTLVSVGTVTAGPGGKAAGQITNGLTVPIVNAVVSQLASGENQVKDTTIDLATPRDPKTHDAVHLASEDAFKTEVAYIAATN